MRFDDLIARASSEHESPAPHEHPALPPFVASELFPAVPSAAAPDWLRLRARWVAVCIMLLTAVLGCTSSVAHVVTPTTDGDFAATVPDPATWTALAARAGNDVMARVEVVKVLLDHDGDELYFLQSRRWEIHFDFAERFLSRPGAPVRDHYRFNEHEYHDKDRRFVLGSVTHYLDQDVWTFDLFASDNLGIADTAAVFGKITRAAFFGPKLRYRPIPTEQVAHLAEVRAVMPVVTSEELFAGVHYEPLEMGEAYGYLKIIPVGKPVPVDVHPYDIIVLGTQPLEIPPVAGVVTDELQAPLGHIAVLAHSRDTPNMALRGASVDPAFLALDGKPVHLTVGTAEYKLELATPDQLARAAAKRRAAAPKLALDTRDVGLPTLAEIDADDVAKFGAKTTQLARVAHLGGIPTPRAFGLPFHAYTAFLAANHLDARVAALLGDPTLRADAGRLRAALEGLRTQILAAPVPAAILDPLIARIHAQLGGSVHVRLRSSTNSEDLAGFSGAGLYYSAKVDPASRDSVEAGLRQVWASVWSWDAFAERDWYGIDHARVAMAILVQESIDDDVVNGVAITGNPYYQGRPAVYVNAQARGGSVTGAAGDEVPEQLLYYTYATGRGLERISASSRSPDKPLLTDLEARQFADQLEKIHVEFTDAEVGTARAVDVEFLVRRNRQLVIVQARPYQIHWTEDRIRKD